MAISVHNPSSSLPYRLTQCPTCGIPVDAILHVTVVR